LVECSELAERMVDDERVERGCCCDDARRRVGLGKIGLDVGREVALAEAVRDDARTARAQPFGDRVADTGPPRDAGDERVQLVRTPTTSRTASLDAFSASRS